MLENDENDELGEVISKEFEKIKKMLPETFQEDDLHPIVDICPDDEGENICWEYKGFYIQDEYGYLYYSFDFLNQPTEPTGSWVLRIAKDCCPPDCISKWHQLCFDLVAQGLCLCGAISDEELGYSLCIDTYGNDLLLQQRVISQMISSKILCKVAGDRFRDLLYVWTDENNKSNGSLKVLSQIMDLKAGCFYKKIGKTTKDMLIQPLQDIHNSDIE